MCTAITFSATHSCFGRTLDLEHTYDEHVVITPRRLPLHFRHLPTLTEHAALIGTATVVNGYALYYDAMNEHGLCMAGLHFVGNAVYAAKAKGKVNLETFELIPFLLGSFQSVKEVKQALLDVRILGDAFCESFPAADLHWLIADHTDAIVLESDRNGIHVYDTPLGVLTNNPPYPFQMQHLALYRGLSAHESANRFCKSLTLPSFSRGMGAIGLPGDFSSTSRFVRAAFVKCNAFKPSSVTETIGQFFHILGTVEQPQGCVIVGDAYERTQYACCFDMDDGIYYYRTYSNSQICGVSLFSETLDGDFPILFPMYLTQRICMQNQTE